MVRIYAKPQWGAGHRRRRCTSEPARVWSAVRRTKDWRIVSHSHRGSRCTENDCGPHVKDLQFHSWPRQAAREAFRQAFVQKNLQAALLGGMSWALRA